MIFVWPWNENAWTKQKPQTNGNRAIWLVYRTDTKACCFWLVKQMLRWKKLHAQELSRNQPILCVDVIRQHNWPVEQCLLHIWGFFGQENEETMFLSFHPLMMNTYQNLFSRWYENRSSQSCRIHNSWSRTISSKILVGFRRDVWTDQMPMTHYKAKRFNIILRNWKSVLSMSPGLSN